MRRSILHLIAVLILCQSECVPAVVDQVTQNVLLDILANIPELLSLNDYSWDYANISTPCENSFGGLRCDLSNQIITAIRFRFWQNLNGTIPSSICNLRNLSELDFDATRLKMPENLQGCNAVQKFSMVGAGLTSFPAAVCDLPALDTLVLSKNPINSTIPDCLGNLTRLVRLEADSCQLFGPIPSTLASLSNLASVVLGDNFLSGPVPTFFCSFPSLSWLDLGPNLLSGPFPACLATSLPLMTLDISGYKDSSSCVSGDLPRFNNRLGFVRLKLQYPCFDNFNLTYVLELQNLRYLYLDGIDLPATGAALIGNMPVLLELSLADCGLSGTIPETFQQLSMVDYLDLSHNHLESPLPDMNAWRSIAVLDISHNLFNSSLPSDLFINKTYIPKLDISNNNFSGPIPPQLFTILIRELDLSNNSFSGCLQRPNADSCVATGIPGLCGCLEPVCGIQECTDSCNGPRPSPSTLCSNGTWNITQPIREITVTVPIQVSGDLQLIPNASVITIQVIQSNLSSARLVIDGCVSFEGGELLLLVPSNYTPLVETLLATFSEGYCNNSSNNTFKSATATIADPKDACQSNVALSLIYRPTSLLVAFGDVENTCPGGLQSPLDPVLAGTTAGFSLAFILGLVAAGITIILLTTILVLFLLRKRIVPSWKLGSQLRRMRANRISPSPS